MKNKSFLSVQEWLVMWPCAQFHYFCVSRHAESALIGCFLYSYNIALREPFLEKSTNPSCITWNDVFLLTRHFCRTFPLHHRLPATILSDRAVPFYLSWFYSSNSSFSNPHSTYIFLSSTLLSFACNSELFAIFFSYRLVEILPFNWKGNHFLRPAFLVLFFLLYTFVPLPFSFWTLTHVTFKQKYVFPRFGWHIFQ
jgi:hypothetical protein